MIVLGLDPSLTNFGWVVVDARAEGAARVLDRGRWQTPAKMEFIDRYVNLRTWLLGKIHEAKPDNMGIEYPVFNDLWSEGMYGLFLYSCEAIKMAKTNVVFFSPGQIKAHARQYMVDNGWRPPGPPKWKMTKPDMVEAARRHTGGKGTWNHNEADAYWVAQSAARFWSYYEAELEESDLTQTERDQFLKLHKPKRGKNAGKMTRKGIIYREDERYFRWSV